MVGMSGESKDTGEDIGRTLFLYHMKTSAVIVAVIVWIALVVLLLYRTIIRQ
jgi:hypothetical protein